MVYLLYEQNNTLRGPIKEQKKQNEELQQFKENGGYMCRDAIPISKYYTRHAQDCSGVVETSYYCDGMT